MTAQHTANKKVYINMTNSTECMSVATFQQRNTKNGLKNLLGSKGQTFFNRMLGLLLVLIYSISIHIKKNKNYN